MENALKLIRKKHKLTQEKFADRIGTTRDYLTKLESSKRGTYTLRGWIKRACEEFGESLDEYLAEEELHIPSEDVAASMDYDSSSVEMSKPPFQNAIAQITGHIGAGSTGEVVVLHAGEMQSIEPVAGWWHIPPAALRTFGGVSAESIAAWPNNGDSMEPTILRTDIVFINTGENTLKPDGIWAVDYGQGRTLKRIRAVKRGKNVRWILSSDNDRYPPEEFSPDEVTIFGRYFFRCTVY